MGFEMICLVGQFLCLFPGQVHRNYTQPAGLLGVFPGAGHMPNGDQGHMIHLDGEVVHYHHSGKNPMSTGATSTGARNSLLSTE